MRFESVSQKQAEIFQFPHESYDALICDGAIRSGKTIMMIASFLEWAMHEFDGCSFGICGKTVRAAERNIIMPLQALRSITRKYNIAYYRSLSLMAVSRGRRKNYFYIFGGKDESSYMLIQGITLAGVLFDEVALMPESFVEQAIARTVSIRAAKLWFNCNPESPLHWFYTEWVLQTEKHNAKRIHFLMDDNPGLAEEDKAKAKANFYGVFYQRYVLGEWVMAEGRIYPMFTEENLYDNSTRRPELEAFSSRYCAVDYGTENPCVFLDIYDDGDVIWIDREYYYDGRHEGRTKTDGEYGKDFDDFFSQRPLLTSVIIDPSASSFKAVLQESGYLVRNADNDVPSGIQHVATLFQRRKIRVHKRCKNFYDEVRSYVWDDKARQRGEEKPLKAKDHAMDSIRYFVNTIIPEWRITG
jgi:PBSX family phage terminase large subunit